MNNTLKVGVLAVCAGLIIEATSVRAQFTYTTNNGGIKISACAGPYGTVTIPDSFNDWPVTAIGDYVFNGASSLTNNRPTVDELPWALLPRAVAQRRA
jgi:hypothetical protein